MTHADATFLACAGVIAFVGACLICLLWDWCERAGLHAEFTLDETAESVGGVE